MQPVHVRCPNGRCQQKLRLNISEKHFGKKLEVACALCKEVFMTFIPEEIKSGVTVVKKTEREKFSRQDTSQKSLEQVFQEISSMTVMGIIITGLIKNRYQKTAMLSGFSLY